MKEINIKEALILLRNDYILESNIDNNKIIFFLRNNIINVISLNYSLKITINDFINGYKEYNFNLITDTTSNDLDLSKDKEYYSLLQKKQ